MDNRMDIDSVYYNKYVDYDDKIEREKFIEWKNSRDEWEEYEQEDWYVGGSEKAEYEAFMRDFRELIAHIRRRVAFVKNWGIKDSYYNYYL